MAMTIVDYMLKAVEKHDTKLRLNVKSMKVDRPLILCLESNSQLLRASALMYWATNTCSFSFFSVNNEGRKTANHASCEVEVNFNPTWIENWNRIDYLIRSRILSLNKGVDEGNSHKLKRGIVYKLFSSLVEYDSEYQGMQEVILDSSELEATAKVIFQAEGGEFYLNPRWIDSLGGIAGFIMNGNDNLVSKTQVFINHGWANMRCDERFSIRKPYLTYNKMQLTSGTLYEGDTYVFDGERIVAIFEGVKVC